MPVVGKSAVGIDQLFVCNLLQLASLVVTLVLGMLIMMYCVSSCCGILSVFIDFRQCFNFLSNMEAGREKGTAVRST